MDRQKTIIRTSILGICANLALAGFKAAVGLLSNSIAIVLDAVNNLSDALSSVITIIGTKLAGRKPDKKHPYGHGRIEYITGMLIAVIVLFAGISSFKESVEKILHPEAASYTVLSLVVIAVAIAVKLLMGRYVKGVGEKLSSQALVASGSDASFDAVLSAGTLVAALVNMIWGLSLEGILGAVISVFIIKAGVEMLLDTLNSITGTRPDKELTDPLKEAIASYPEVHGVYDLTLHNYGPTNIIATAHIEVDDSMTAREIHHLTRVIAVEIYERFGIVLTLGVYAAGDSSPVSGQMKEQLAEIVAKHPEILQMHGFYVDEDAKRVMCDLVMDFAADAPTVCSRVRDEIAALWPDYHFDVVLDSDFSD